MDFFMEQSAIKKIYELIDNIPVTLGNTRIIEEIKIDLEKRRLCISIAKNRDVRTKKRK